MLTPKSVWRLRLRQDETVAPRLKHCKLWNEALGAVLASGSGQNTSNDDQEKALVLTFKDIRVKSGFQSHDDEANNYLDISFVGTSAWVCA